MKEKIKKIIKKYLVGFILGAVICGTISVYAVTYFPGINTTYDNTDSGMTSTNVQDALDELYNACYVESTLTDSILDQEEIVTSGDGLYEDEYEDNQYIYKGKNVNNYITFNDEKAGWRIISINSDGTIKIMKDESIGGIAWDQSGGNYGSNNWNRPADLNTYLNNTYYNGLSEKAQNQIVTAIYNVGSVKADNDNMNEQIKNEKSTTSKIKVALPAASEYIKASSNLNCRTFYTFNDYNINDICSNSDWMYINTAWWLLSPVYGSSSDVFAVVNYGNLSHDGGADSKVTEVRPVVTLSSNIKITGGDGSQSNPYTIE